MVRDEIDVAARLRWYNRVRPAKVKFKSQRKSYTIFQMAADLIETLRDENKALRRYIKLNEMPDPSEGELTKLLNWPTPELEGDDDEQV